jgi:uncharacterized protein (TIGR02757 family)
MRFQKAKTELDKVLNSLDSDSFIAQDPISIPKRFTTKQDIEIASFFACTLAWGNRKTIINNTNKLMSWMGEEPHRFILEHTDSELKPFEKFVHRTFNSSDCLYFIEVLKHFYTKQGSLEYYFNGTTVKERISNFHHHFFNFSFELKRSRKHVANPAKNSSAKRLNMFLRWMVRKDEIDFGIWKNISSSELQCPLDVHVQRAAFHFNLLTRKQQDWKAVEELSNNLQLLDYKDPIKYDMALFKWSEGKLLS